MTMTLVRHDQRLALVVGDVDRGHAELALDAAELELHLLAQLAVERGQRLVEQQEVGLEHQRAGDRDALLLPAGQLVRPALAEPAEPDERRDSARPAPAIARASKPRIRSGKATLSAAVRCGNSASLWNTMPIDRRQGGSGRAPAGRGSRSRPRSGAMKPAIMRRSVVLPRAGRPEDGEEGALRQREGDAVDRQRGAEAPADAVEPHHRLALSRCQRLQSLSPAPGLAGDTARAADRGEPSAVDPGRARRCSTPATPTSRLEGRKALVTGASRGIGAALAVGLARFGADVAIAGRDPARLDRLRGRHRRHGPARGAGGDRRPVGRRRSGPAWRARPTPWAGSTS